MNSLNLNNTISTGENTFIARMSLLELKNIIDFDAIEINCEKDVPYIPLEDEATIYLNIDKKNLYYNKETKVVNVNDKFRVLDGEIRLIDFVNNTEWYEDKMEQIVTLNIICCDIDQAKKLLNNIGTIPVNRESINNISNETMNPFEEVRELIKKVKETRDTIENTDEEMFYTEDLKILAEECQRLSLVCNNTIMLIKESEE